MITHLKRPSLNSFIPTQVKIILPRILENTDLQTFLFSSLKIFQLQTHSFQVYNHGAPIQFKTHHTSQKSQTHQL